MLVNTKCTYMKHSILVTRDSIFGFLEWSKNLQQVNKNIHFRTVSRVGFVVSKQSM